MRPATVTVLLLTLLGCARTQPEKAAPSATTAATESAHEPPPPASTTFAPDDPLAPYPGAKLLCNRLVFQEGHPLYWRSWTTPEDYGKVAALYKDRASAKALRSEESKEKDKLEVHMGSERVLMVYPASKASAHPQCGKPLDAADKTVVMLSELRMP